MAFVDYEKAFDLMAIHLVLEALQKQGINTNYIKLISDIYKFIHSLLGEIFRSIDWINEYQ